MTALCSVRVAWTAQTADVINCRCLKSWQLRMCSDNWTIPECFQCVLYHVSCLKTFLLTKCKKGEDKWNVQHVAEQQSVECNQNESTERLTCSLCDMWFGPGLVEASSQGKRWKVTLSPSSDDLHLWLGPPAWIIIILFYWSQITGRVRRLSAFLLWFND